MRESIWKLAREQGVSIEALLEPLRQAAERHFNPELQFEVAEREGRVDLYAAFRVKETPVGPKQFSLAKVQSLGMDVQDNDELVFQVFFLAADAAEAVAQDAEYGELYPIRSEGCGFEPVARRAVAHLVKFAEDSPEDLLRNRVLTELAATSDERAEGVVLRRTDAGLLVLKRPTVVSPELLASASRLDVPAGAPVEVVLREVDPVALVDQLFRLDAQLSGQEREALLAAFAAAKIRVDRKTLFGRRFENFAQQRSLVHAFCSLVSPESDGRYVKGFTAADLA